MSSKSAEAGSPPARHGGSITRRFLLLYVGSTGALLFLAVGFLYWTLKQNLDVRDHALVVSKARVLRVLLQDSPAKAEALASEIRHEASEGPLSYYLRVLDAAGNVLLETPGMARALPPEVFPPAGPVLPEPAWTDVPHMRHHEHFILLAATAETGAKPAEPRRVQVALDISAELALLATYRRELLLILIATLAGAALVGAWLARKGIDPILTMTRRTRHITIGHLNERIQVSQWPAELADLAHAFNAMLDRLEDSFARLTRFAADLAHEMRTPVNNLCGEAEVALARCRTPAEYQEVLASALEEYERLTRMIDGLLFLARADNPRADIEQEEFDARTEMEAVREYQEAYAEEQQVTVTCAGEASLTGNAGLFRRALSNVLANALRHTPPGGRVQMVVRTLDDGAVEVRVQDTGPGIPEADLPHVFERFYRSARPGAAAVSSAKGGTGLGLAIVRSIMRLHGGTATAESRPNQGATIILRFPPAGA